MPIPSEEVFVIKGSSMSSMAATPVTPAVRLENYTDTINHLFVHHPRILPGTQIQPGSLDPPHFVHILTPLVLGPHRIDHVFLDQFGSLTLVRLATDFDPSMARAWMGMTIEILSTWFASMTPRELQNQMESYWASNNIRIARIIHELWPEGRTIDAFWENVRLRMEAGYLRFILAMPQVPPPLTFMMEFLNARMQSVQIMGLELRLFGDESSSMLLVPRIVGASRHGDAGEPPETFIWTPGRIENAIAAVADPLLSRRLQRVLEWVVSRQLYMPGTTQEYPAFGMRGLSGERLLTFDMAGNMHLFFHEINLLDSILKRDDLLLSLRNLALLDPGLDLKRKPVAVNLRRNLFSLSESEFSELLATLGRYTGT